MKILISKFVRIVIELKELIRLSIQRGFLEELSFYSGSNDFIGSTFLKISEYYQITVIER